MTVLVDSHCHLDFSDYADECDEVIRRALENGVTRMLTIGTKLEETPELLALTQKYEQVFAAVGVHPEYAAENENITADDICALTDDPKVVAIGEAGLDYHYGAPETHEAQRKLFRTHLHAAKKAKLPIIIHARDAEEDMISILREEADENLKGVLHCFSSGAELAEAGLELGFFISASGIITFKKSEELREIFKNIPMDKLLIETDAPFLAPVPFRGKRNEPSFVVKTAEMLALIKGVSFKEIADRTTKNFLTLFSKAC